MLSLCESVSDLVCRLCAIVLAEAFAPCRISFGTKARDVIDLFHANAVFRFHATILEKRKPQPAIRWSADHVSPLAE